MIYLLGLLCVSLLAFALLSRQAAARAPPASAGCAS